MTTRHVILSTYGEPPAPAFFDQLAYSWRILLGLTRTIAPIPKPVLPIIALSRARQRARSWTEEDYASPLEPITSRQARHLEAALTRRDPATTWRVHVAYEFRRPLMADVLAAIPAGDSAVVIPMYAADSDFTHGLSRTAAHALARRDSSRAPVSVLPALEADTLGALSAAYVREALAAQPDWRGAKVALVLVAHGTLLNPARPVDTGLAATEALCEAIRSRLAGDFGLVVNGWLNHTRGGRWTEPPIDQALRQVADAGFTRVAYYPYGFLADNAESQLEGRVALRAEPRLEALHLPCLNESPLLMDALAELLAPHSRERKTA
jgi:protoheme ferro-lyase